MFYDYEIADTIRTELVNILNCDVLMNFLKKWIKKTIKLYTYNIIRVMV